MFVRRRTDPRRKEVPMPQRLTPQELVYELVKAFDGEPPDVTDLLEDDDPCPPLTFRLLP